MDLSVLCQTLDRLRAGFSPVPGTVLPPGLSGRLLTALAGYREHPVVRAFVEDVERSARQPIDCGATRAALRQRDADLVLGFFHVPYTEELGLDAFAYERVLPDERLARRYPSPAVRAVSTRFATAGFRAPLCVALFPEGFMAREAIVADDAVFYFMDRFVERFWRVTSPVLHRLACPDTLVGLKSISPSEVLVAAATWVHLHEHFHRQGFLPLPDYLHVKQTRSAAGLEEVRVDVLTIIACLQEAARGLPGARTVADLVLAERLFRYPFQATPQSNYDARGVQVLFSFLERRGVLEVRGEQLHLHMEDLVPALKELVIAINHLEQRIRATASGEALQRRQQFIQRLAGYRDEHRTFEYLPFYRQAFETLSRDGIRAS